MNDPNAVRELIQIYKYCEWRETKLQIIRELSRYPTQRALEFLFKLAQTPDDIPIAEAALWSLGQTHQRIAALFLTQFYPTCGDILKPTVVGALGQIPDRTLAKELLSELPKAWQAKKLTLTKNLILTLGELKVQEALPTLLELALQKSHAPIAQSALLAIGKLSRNVRILQQLENRFREEDLFDYQLFLNVKTQIQFRSSWKLEDYLTKLFDSETIHPSLPFELNHFSPEDVKEGLKLFTDKMKDQSSEGKIVTARYFERLCLALSHLDFPGISDWYSELIDLSSLDLKQLHQVLTSISCHFNSKMIQPLNQIKEHPLCPVLNWLKVVSQSLPTPESEFRTFFRSEIFAQFSDELKISAVNHLYEHGLCVQTHPSQLQWIGEILGQLLDTSKAPALQARLLRALGDLEIQSKKAALFIKDYFASLSPGKAPDPNLLSSCFKFLEQVPDKNITPVLIELITKVPLSGVSSGMKSAFLQCIRSLPSLPESNAPLDSFLKRNLEAKADDQVRVDTLHLLEKHPRPSLLPDVLGSLKGDSRVQMAAIIALRTLGNEPCAEAIAEFLNSEQKSLAGRALDTLTALPGMRPKRLVIDYFREHCEDSDVCEKVIRSLKAPEIPSDYFVKIVDEVIQKFPQHPQLDGLILLRERMTPIRTGRDAVTVKGIDIEKIDLELAKKCTGYQTYDESIKSALRSAELPYLHRKLFDEFVDKSVAIVEYCKAVDILLEKELGRKVLFPKLERSLYEFDSALHLAGLHEDYPSADRVLSDMGLEKQFDYQSFPLHKMTTIAQGIRTGRIVRDHFKILDGLRAWAVMILLFGRKFKTVKPVLNLKATSDEQVVSFCKRLMSLQDVRNPLAHRQIVVKFPGLEEVREEVLSLLSSFHKII